MLRMVRPIHSCSGSRELFGYIVRSLALILALGLVPTHPLSAMPPGGEHSPSMQSSGAAAAERPDATAEAAKGEDVDVQVEVVPDVQKGDSKLLVKVDGANAAADDDGAASDPAPTPRTAQVIVMDGKHHSLRGATVHLRVHAAPATDKAAPAAQEMRGAEPAPPPIPEELRNDPDPSFSLKGSPLPLIALVGFLLLIGGFLPPAKTRKATPVVHL